MKNDIRKHKYQVYFYYWDYKVKENMYIGTTIVSERYCARKCLKYCERA